MSETSALVACPTCGRNVARSARTCPECGHARPAGGAPAWVGGAGKAALIVVLLLLAWAMVAAAFA